MVDLHQVKINTGGIDEKESLDRLKFEKNEKLMFVPTTEEDVRNVLNLLNEPEYLDYEDNVMRRKRLSDLLYENRNYMDKYKQSKYFSQIQCSLDLDEDMHQEEEFYTPASIELIKARQYIVKYSLEMSSRRLSLFLAKFKGLNIQDEILKKRKLNQKLSSIELIDSQIVSNRPISQLAIFKPNNIVAVSSWSGDIELVDGGTLDKIKQYRTAHQGKANGVDWSPDGTKLVSGGTDGLIKIWNIQSETSTPVSTLSGHYGRVSNVKFHPSAHYIASSSFDLTWALWDLNKNTNILSQEGHANEVYTISFQVDGSLLASAGLDSLGLIWDLRSGQSIMTLHGHLKAVYGLDWSPNGYQIVTGSGDGTIKVWDLRKQEEISTILAHNNIVSDVRFEQDAGNFLVSGGYDNMINIYNADSWTKLKTLEGHTDRILSVCIGKDGLQLFSGGWDRSIKSWTLPY